MLKIQMLTRHTGPNGKMEKGFEYLLPRSYAQELIDHGLAVPMTLGSAAPPDNVTSEPSELIIWKPLTRNKRGQFQKRS